MSKEELRKTFFDELAPFVTKITSEDGYQTSDLWNFAIASRELKFKVRNMLLRALHLNFF